MAIISVGVLGYIGIVQHKEHSPKVLSIPPGTPCIYTEGCKTRYTVIRVIQSIDVNLLLHPSVYIYIYIYVCVYIIVRYEYHTLLLGS